MAEARKISQDVCSHCGVSAPDHFCAACGHIQPVGRDTDYFAFFGLPRKLRLNEGELEKSFYALSRQFHPDFFMNASPEERQASIERSSLLNDAYRTLRDPISRTLYLLSLEGYKEAEKKAPPDLLEEVFELNMQIEEIKAAKKTGDDDEVAEARRSLDEALGNLRKKMAEIDGRLGAMFDEWDTALDKGTGDERKAVLDRMSELLSHRSYIRNLVRDIKEEI
ncbi:MAG TPA: Fe-S protein assembly co-chaperone HscB [Blastocatellia bacterium]|jgi:molecular chaperone HscB|nr:Fe-S protein assembly co-chaperone HscB [Blastocatellia bacterium]